MSDDEFIIDDEYLPRMPLETQHIKIIPFADYDTLIRERDALLAALGKVRMAYVIDSSTRITLKAFLSIFDDVDENLQIKATDWYVKQESERDTLRAILSELVNPQDAGLAYENTKMLLYCQYCLETGKVRAGLFPHSGDCPIVRGRKLYKETNPDGK